MVCLGKKRFCRWSPNCWTPWGSTTLAAMKVDALLPWAWNGLFLHSLPRMASLPRQALLCEPERANKGNGRSVVNFGGFIRFHHGFPLP